MTASLLQQCLLVGAGGFLGAIVRFLIGIGLTGRIGSAFPWATFLINVSGSFVLGLFLTLLPGRSLSPALRLFFAVGFLGAYTTFSTFEFESASLGFSWVALANLVGSVVAGYAAVQLGIRLGQV